MEVYVFSEHVAAQGKSVEIFLDLFTMGYPPKKVEKTWSKMVSNGLKGILNRTCIFFESVENDLVRTPPKCGIFHSFIFLFFLRVP